MIPRGGTAGARASLARVPSGAPHHMVQGGAICNLLQERRWEKRYCGGCKRKTPHEILVFYDCFATKCMRCGKTLSHA